MITAMAMELRNNHTRAVGLKSRDTKVNQGKKLYFTHLNKLRYVPASSRHACWISMQSLRNFRYA